MTSNKKNVTLRRGLIKTGNFRRFQVSIWLYKQNRKLGNLGKFSFALNFDCLDCIKCRKAENFHKKESYLCKNNMP